ncbi:MAG: PilT/PilU family type 4a pilus ATPase [Verrucomicrobiota bacterium]
MQDITDYLRQTVELTGSDLHLSVGAPPCARVDGRLRPLDEASLTVATARDLVLATLSESQRSRLEEDWELDYALQVEGLGRFRGNVHYTRQGLEAAFRFIPRDIPELATLGHSDAIHDICRLPSGLVLVTGITGSGKSTTLASMVKRIAESRSGVIVTIEDPIEFLFEHSRCLIKQREVGSTTRDFPIALRQSLRQDPDVIVVSELRDLETIRIAITAAETGHLVLGTLHTVDAPKTIDRLVDVFPGGQQPQIIAQLSNVLEAILSQRLLPRADGEGRILASEVLRMNHGIRTCIRDRKTEQLVGMMEIGSQDGNQTIDESLTQLWREGQIDLQEALLHSRDRKLFQSFQETEKRKFGAGRRRA